MNYYQHSVKNASRNKRGPVERSLTQEVHCWFVRHEWKVYTLALLGIIVVSKIIELAHKVF